MFYVYTIQSRYGWFWTYIVSVYFLLILTDFSGSIVLLLICLNLEGCLIVFFFCNRNLTSAQLFIHILTSSTIFLRGIVMGRCSSSSSDSHGTEEKVSQVAAISHSKLTACGFAKKIDAGKICNSV